VQVEIKLHGVLRRHRPDTAGGASHHPFSLPVTAGETAASLLARLNIPPEMVHGVAVNGQQAGLDTPVHGGDVVHLFPPAAGG
jgi:sulfur carrier protein ThiS